MQKLGLSTRAHTPKQSIPLPGLQDEEDHRLCSCFPMILLVQCLSSHLGLNKASEDQRAHCRCKAAFVLSGELGFWLSRAGESLRLSLLFVGVLGAQQTCAGFPCCSEQLLSAHRISYCTTDKLQNKVFAYVAQSQESGALECHAFLSPKKKIVSTSLWLFEGGYEALSSSPSERAGPYFCDPTWK